MTRRDRVTASAGRVAGGDRLAVTVTVTDSATQAALAVPLLALPASLMALLALKLMPVPVVVETPPGGRWSIMGRVREDCEKEV